MSAPMDTRKGLIAWFARNKVAANLLMIAIIIIGLVTAMTIRKQMFPQIEINHITITIAYPGAAPQDVEEGITVKLEEALKGIQGLKRVITRSNRGSASANIEVMETYDAQEVLDEVKAAVGAISNFPDGMEKPQIKRVKYRQDVMYISLYGDMNNFDLKRYGKKIDDELRALPGVNIVDYYSGANYEIGIEVSRDKLREYHLTFQQVAQAIRGSSLNRSAGQIRAKDGYISVRVENQAYVGKQFARLPLLTRADGTKVLLGEVAKIDDGFAEGINYTKLNGKNAVTFFVGATRDQSITDVAAVLKKYIAKRQQTLPQGLTLAPWVDFTYYLNGRLNMMFKNMVFGGVLVFVILALFLRIKLAMWVMMGLPVSFFGAIMLLPLSWVDVTINIGSLFAFIMVLGVVVDDAIVIGESVHSETEDKGHGIDNVIRGAQKVAMPATFGVLTTVAAFAPMALKTGPTAAFPNSIGFVVIFCLLFSLVESKWILPAHLANMKPLPPTGNGPVRRVQRRVDSALKHFIQHVYLPGLRRSLTYRYVIMASFTAIIIITAGMFAGRLVSFVGTPPIPNDFSRIELKMNASSSEQATLKAALQLQHMMERVRQDVIKKYGKPMVDKFYVSMKSRTQAELQAKLVDPEKRPIGTFALSDLWRQAMPQISGMKSLKILDTIFAKGDNDGDVSFRILGANINELKAAARQLKAALGKLDGVYEIADSQQTSAKQARFSLKPVAYSLGLTAADIARQAGFSLYGVEAQRIMRDSQEIKVMVRYPKSQRDTLSAVNDILITTPAGSKVPLSELANIKMVDGVNQIYREDGRRTITVWASLDYQKIQPLAVAGALQKTAIPSIEKHYPGLKIEEAGSLKDERSDLFEQIRNIALILLPIYLLLALPLRSYVQPLMIMSVIPFGIVGAIWGHIILGLQLSSLSIFGIFAAIGVVVNDSLVMVDYVNQARGRGETLIDAVLHGGEKRFRAIILTSLTTFFGLIPIIFEPSLQAKFVIPMAVSLAFGVAFATIVTLLLVPCLYLVLDDVQHLLRKWGKWFVPYRHKAANPQRE